MVKCRIPYAIGILLTVILDKEEMDKVDFNCYGMLGHNLGIMIE